MWIKNWLSNKIKIRSHENQCVYNTSTTVYMQKQISCVTLNYEAVTSLIGLSKNERPILDHHAKAHNFEIRRISCGFHVKFSGFHEILGHSPHPAFIKLKSFCWNTCFYKVLGGFQIQVKSGWNPPDFERQLPGMVSPMFMYTFWAILTSWDKFILQGYKYLLYGNF